MLAAVTAHVHGRRESKIVQHNPHSIKNIQKLYDLLSYYSNIPDSFKAKQAHFQEPNGLPIFLKGGPLDKILFGATVGLIAIGMTNMFKMLYVMAFPAKNK